MIKILKHGKNPRLKTTCPECGCEFEFAESDLKVDGTVCLTTYPCQFKRYVMCPECGKVIFHDTTISPDLNEIVMDPNINLEYYVATDHCASCPNNGGPKDAFGNPVAGDSPCDYSPHSKKRVTC